VAQGRRERREILQRSNSLQQRRQLHTGSGAGEDSP
jgi:hypothetical protein